MLGLRGSGKTTYLAALWHYLESGEIKDRLVVPQLQPDRNYLNGIRNSWLALKPLGRTSLRTRATVSMQLKDRVVGTEISITLPDLSGETFRLQWFTRKAPASYADFARTCTGAFLFLHSDQVRRTHAIKARLLKEGNDEGREQDIPIRASENWTPEQSSTQVQIVDILQLLLGLREKELGMRLAVIVSAWDLVNAKIGPASWLASRFPLLSQFLRANEAWLPSEVFGVSSQGGDLTNDRDRLLGAMTASARCIAKVGDGTESVSITAPLRFLLSI